MLSSIFYKEFLKIRWPLLALLLANGLLLAYICAETRHLFIMDHPEIVWYRVLHLGHIYYDSLRYAPAVTGLLIAVIQFLPEMTSERLRLSLHLPVAPHWLVLSHLVVGLTTFLLVVTIDVVILALLTASYFPKAAVYTTLITVLPWGIAGIATYLGGAMALLEPGYAYRFSNLMIAFAVVMLFLKPADPCGYSRILLLLCFPVLLMIPAVLLPAYRFRYRRAG